MKPLAISCFIPSERSKKERITVKKVPAEQFSSNLFNIELPPPAAVTKFSLNFEADSEFMELFEKAKAHSGAPMPSPQSTHGRKSLRKGNDPKL